MLKVWWNWIYSTCLAYCSPEHQPASVHLNDRRLKVLRRVGEGGYSYVYLVEQLKSAHQVENGNMHSCEEEDDENSRRYLFALKRILIQSEETKEVREGEMQVFHVLCRCFPQKCAISDCCQITGTLSDCSTHRLSLTTRKVAAWAIYFFPSTRFVQLIGISPCKVYAAGFISIFLI